MQSNPQQLATSAVIIRVTKYSSTPIGLRHYVQLHRPLLLCKWQFNHRKFHSLSANDTSGSKCSMVNIHRYIKKIKLITYHVFEMAICNIVSMPKVQEPIMILRVTSILIRNHKRKVVLLRQFHSHGYRNQQLWHHIFGRILGSAVTI